MAWSIKKVSLSLERRRADQPSFSTSLLFFFLLAALPRLAHTRLQYFLCLVYSWLAVNSFPHVGRTVIRLDFQFSGFRCLFFHWNRQPSEQNLFILPLGGCMIAAPQFGQNRVAAAIKNSCSSWVVSSSIILPSFQKKFLPYTVVGGAVLQGR